ncbi:MAG: hypothetical protein LBM05_02290 [Endomicrobium sp.]|jgi:hypothetical protein|nr:hypothetical protein [Endomicrobium sp.]
MKSKLICILSCLMFLNTFSFAVLPRCNFTGSAVVADATPNKQNPAAPANVRYQTHRDGDWNRNIAPNIDVKPICRRHPVTGRYTAIPLPVTNFRRHYVESVTVSPEPTLNPTVEQETQTDPNPTVEQEINIESVTNEEEEEIEDSDLEFNHRLSLCDRIGRGIFWTIYAMPPIASVMIIVSTIIG